MGMFPLIDTDGQEGAQIGDRIWHKEAEYTVVKQTHGSVTFRRKGVENGDNDVAFWEDKGLPDVS
jgi:hypothetical protein